LYQTIILQNKKVYMDTYGHILYIIIYVYIYIYIYSYIYSYIYIYIYSYIKNVLPGQSVFRCSVKSVSRE